MSESAAPVRHPATLKKTILDVVDAVTSYYGVAPAGAATSEAVWMIQKLTFGPGNSMLTQHADGNAEFDNVWDNRAGLTYT